VSHSDSSKLLTIISPTVIWVRHGEKEENDPLYPNSPGWQIAAQLDPPKSVDTDEPIVEKSQPDSFSNPRFGELIETETTKHEANGVELYFMGLQSDFCIQATTKAALQRYENDPAVKKIIVVKDAHATYGSGGKSDLEVSESINVTLAGLGAELMSSNEVFS
jgi:nicotinamidase-related amidase